MTYQIVSIHPGVRSILGSFSKFRARCARARVAAGRSPAFTIPSPRDQALDERPVVMRPDGQRNLQSECYQAGLPSLGAGWTSQKASSYTCVGAMADPWAGWRKCWATRKATSADVLVTQRLTRSVVDLHMASVMTNRHCIPECSQTPRARVRKDKEGSLD